MLLYLLRPPDEGKNAFKTEHSGRVLIVLQGVCFQRMGEGRDISVRDRGYTSEGTYVCVCFIFNAQSTRTSELRQKKKKKKKKKILKNPHQTEQQNLHN